MSSDNKLRIKSIISDSHARMLVTAAFGSGWNLIYALYHLILSLVYHSYWFLTMGVYYLAVCGMRSVALSLTPHRQNLTADKRALRVNGILTLLLAVIFSGVVVLTVVEKHNNHYNKIVAISIAAYTFYCVVTAIINLFKIKKRPTIRRILLRNVSLVYAAGSLFGLERTLLGTFGDGQGSFTTTMECVSGIGFFLLIAAFGIHLLIWSVHWKSRRPKKEPADPIEAPQSSEAGISTAE